MGKRISKKVRNEAALLCAIAASNGIALASTGGSQPAFLVAVEARVAAIRSGMSSHDDYYRETCAEAEALLRTGWTP